MDLDEGEENRRKSAQEERKRRAEENQLLELERRNEQEQQNFEKIMAANRGRDRRGRRQVISTGSVAARHWLLISRSSSKTVRAPLAARATRSGGNADRRSCREGRADAMNRRAADGIAPGQRAVWVTEPELDRAIDVRGRRDPLLGDRAGDVDDVGEHALADQPERSRTR